MGLKLNPVECAHKGDFPNFDHNLGMKNVIALLDEITYFYLASRLAILFFSHFLV